MRLSVAVVTISSLAGSVSAAFVEGMTVPKTMLSNGQFNLTIALDAQRQVPFLQEKIYVGIIDNPEQYSDLTTLGYSTGSVEITSSGRFTTCNSHTVAGFIGRRIILKQN